MKPRTLLILLVVVAGLAAFIWFYERELPGSEERAGLADRLLRGLEAGDVTALVIESGGGSVRLERVAEPATGEGEDGAADELPPLEPEPEWRIAAPASLAGARADRFAVERLIGSLVALEKRRTMTTEEADRAAAGLEPPRAKVTVVREGEDEVTLELGADVPASANVLAAIAGAAEVYVVGGTVAGDLDRAPGDWRDREIFASGRHEIERLTLAPAGGERVVLTRRGDDEHWLDEPVIDRADSSTVDQLVTDVLALRAEDFVDLPEAAPPGGDLAALGLDPARGVIEIASAGREPFRIEVGAETDGGWYGRTGGQVFEAVGRLPEALAREPAEWQSRSLSARRLYQIDRLTIDEEGGGEGRDPLELDRDGPDWRRDGEAIPYTPVSDLLFAVTDARADRLVRRETARAAGHLADPALSITLSGGDAQASETVTLYPATAGGEVPATVTGRDFALYLAPATARTLRDSLDRLREAEPLPREEPEEDGEDGIEIETEEGG